jgi:hypothetical protein
MMSIGDLIYEIIWGTIGGGGTFEINETANVAWIGNNNYRLGSKLKLRETIVRKSGRDCEIQIGLRSKCRHNLSPTPSVWA